LTGQINSGGETPRFVEVKSRLMNSPGHANVDPRKQRQIARTARVYRQLFGLQEMQYRFDVVSVLMEKGLAPRLELFRGFWNEANFRAKVRSKTINTGACKAVYRSPNRKIFV
jgi:Holliday junction resolvase-like predicted endonuclease